MIALFFVKPGHVAPVPCQERKIVNAESKVVEARSGRRPNNSTHCLLLHHDSASVHTTATTLDYPETNRVQLVTQLPILPA